MPKALPPEVRDRLLDSAEALGWRIGFGRMTVDDVVQGAGISKGAFYRFFTSKEDLGDAIVLRHTGSVYAKQKEVAENAALSWTERLRRMLMVPIETANEKYKRHSYHGEMAATIYGPGKRALGTVMSREIDLYAQVIKAGQKARVFRSGNAAGYAKVLSLTISAFLPPYIWLEEPHDAVTEAKGAVDFLLHSMSCSGTLSSP